MPRLQRSQRKGLFVSGLVFVFVETSKQMHNNLQTDVDSQWVEHCSCVACLVLFTWGLHCACAAYMHGLRKGEDHTGIPRKSGFQGSLYFSRESLGNSIFEEFHRKPQTTPMNAVYAMGWGVHWCFSIFFEIRTLKAPGCSRRLEIGWKRTVRRAECDEQARINIRR